MMKIILEKVTLHSRHTSRKLKKIRPKSRHIVTGKRFKKRAPCGRLKPRRLSAIKNIWTTCSTNMKLAKEIWSILWTIFMRNRKKKSAKV